MTRILGVGLALAGLVGVGCGHATPTGSASNDWATPTGRATATNPRVVNPMEAAHPARDRSDFAKAEAPPLQPGATPSTETPVAPEPVGAVPPPAQPLPPPETVPDIAAPDTGAHPADELPPYVEPIHPQRP